MQYYTHMCVSNFGRIFKVLFICAKQPTNYLKNKTLGLKNYPLYGIMQ